MSSRFAGFPRSSWRSSTAMSPYQRTKWPNGAARIRESRESLSDVHVSESASVEIQASHFYFFLPSAKVGCHPAPFWLGAAAMTLTFFFLGFLASRLLLCWPLAMSISLGLRMTQIEMQNLVR